MKILIVGDAFITKEQFQEKCWRLEELGHEVEVMEWGPSERSDLENIIRNMEKGNISDDSSLDEIKKHIIGKDALFVDFCPVPASLIRQVKLIGVTRSGLSNIDLAAARESQVEVIHISGRNAIAVAEFTIGLMFAVSRNIAYAHHAMMNGHWQKNYAYEPAELEGKRVGLLGFGEIGRTVAKKLFSMGCEVVFYDPYYSGISKYASSVTMEDLLRTSDFISIHVKLADATKNMISNREFRMMRSSSFFINTARAEIVNSEALVEALQNNLIAGAALDVFLEEPLNENDPLLQMNNVVLTSHIAGSTPEALVKSVDLLFDEFISKSEKFT